MGVSNDDLQAVTQCRSTELPPGFALFRRSSTLDCSLRDTGDELLGADGKHEQQRDDGDE